MNDSYQIPPDIYETVQDLLIASADAAFADDEVLRQSYFGQLRDYCEEQTAAGRGSGFMWEALADITDALEEQIRYYEKSLEIARQNAEPIQTALLDLAKCYLEKGNTAHAELLLQEAWQQAIGEDDTDTEGEAAALLLQIPE